MKSRYTEQLREFLQDLCKRDYNIVQNHVAETEKAWEKAKEVLTPILEETIAALKKTGRQAAMTNGGSDIALTLQLYGKSSQRVFEFSPVSHKHQPPRMLISEGNKPLYEEELEKLTPGVAETLMLKILVLTAYGQKL